MFDFKKYIPKKFWNRIDRIELDSDLIDDCKYMLYMSNDYLAFDEFKNIPVKNIKELQYIIKNAIKK